MSKTGQGTTKQRILQSCINILKLRMDNAAAAMKESQDAANAEEKSSAGDKYETSRAMSHIEKDMFSAHLASIRQELAALSAVDCGQTTIITKGSLVDCDGVMFFIAAGIGKISFEGKEIFVVSPSAPAARSLLNKVVGDSFSFNNKLLFIREIS